MTRDQPVVEKYKIQIYLPTADSWHFLVSYQWQQDLTAISAQDTEVVGLHVLPQEVQFLLNASTTSITLGLLTVSVIMMTWLPAVAELDSRYCTTKQYKVVLISHFGMHGFDNWWVMKTAVPTVNFNFGEGTCNWDIINKYYNRNSATDPLLW